MASTSKPKKPFVLNHIQDLPYRATQGNRHDAKLEAGYAPTLVAAAEVMSTLTVASAMGTVGGVINYTAGWFARHVIQKNTNPVPYDLLLMKLDKGALQILQARLEWMDSQRGFVEMIKGARWEGGDIVYANQTVREVINSAVNCYAQLMRGEHPWTTPGQQPRPPSPEESLPALKEGLELFLAGGGQRNLGEDAAKDLRNRIAVACCRYHFTRKSIQELQVYMRRQQDAWFD